MLSSSQILFLPILIPVLTTVSFIFLQEIYTKYNSRRLPPGSTGIKALREISRDKPWETFLEYQQRYGDLSSASMFGRVIISIGSAKIAKDLLEERSINYADRPRTVMGSELSGWGKIMLLSNYDDWFRTHRKWVAQEIGSHASVSKLQWMIESEARRFLKSVLADPDNVQAHVRTNISSIVLRLTYGYAPTAGNDHLVELADKANTQLSFATSFAQHIVDIIHPLKHIPSWFPGAGFQILAKKYARVVRDFVEIPHSYVKAQMASGTALPSLASRLMQHSDLTDELEDSVKWATATLYQGGTDAPNSVAYAFFLAMTLHPRVVREAQRELDAVVGKGRLPTFADRASLPYMEALHTELLRWQTPGPLTVRNTRVDDTYNGYFIPAGSYIVANIWAILRDERTYSDPLEFKPERFLGDNPEQHPSSVCFGFGRRKCPGNYLAHSAVWLMCAQTLAVFNISKYVGDDGVEITPKYNLVGQTIAAQAPFKCSVKPRSAEAERLIREEFDESSI